MSEDELSVYLRPLREEDWPAVKAIYIEGINTGMATFETETPSWSDWNGDHLEACRIVAYDGDDIVGWAALSSVSGRCVYAGVAKVSVYVAADARGKRIGKSLLRQLVLESEEAGIWTLEAGIFPKNKASIALHKACGFRQVGYRERLGQLAGEWRDVNFLERRSTQI